MKKVTALLGAGVMLFSCLLGACTKPQPTPQPPVEFTVLPASVELSVGEQVTLTVNCPQTETASFRSNNPSVATVNGQGVVTGVSEGSTKIEATVKEVKKEVPVTVRKAEDPAKGKVEGKNVTYRFTVPENGLYSFVVEREGDADISAADDGAVFAFDGGYTTRLKSRKAEGNRISIGTKFFKAGTHELVLSDSADLLGESKIVVSAAHSYCDDGLSLAKTWMDVLYQETGYNTEKPNYVGYVETRGWEDIWTHCQYLPYSMYIAQTEQSEEYDRRVTAIADELLIGKMLRADGSVNTIYRADSDVFQVSIESNMPTNKYELWRGNSAFVEEMMNCYLYTGQSKYLEYAKTAADYILEKWSKTTINGIFGGFYTRYTNSAGGSLDVMSTGRAVMVLSQLYSLTGVEKYRSAAKTQAKILLLAQQNPYPELDGLFASEVNSTGGLNEFRHGNAYANAMFGLAWVYKITGDAQYLTAIDKGIKVLDKVYDDEYGMVIVIDGQVLKKHPSTGAMYMAGRIGQAIMACAAIVGEESYYRQGERVLEFAMGRNYGNRNVMNEENGWYYYTVEYNGMSNVETSCEIYLAQLEYYYLTHIWGLELKVL